MVPTSLSSSFFTVLTFENIFRFYHVYCITVCNMHESLPRETIACLPSLWRPEEYNKMQDFVSHLCLTGCWLWKLHCTVQITQLHLLPFGQGLCFLERDHLHQCFITGQTWSLRTILYRSTDLSLVDLYLLCITEQQVPLPRLVPPCLFVNIMVKTDTCNHLTFVYIFVCHPSVSIFTIIIHQLLLLDYD